MTDEKKEPFETEEPIEAPVPPPQTESEANPTVQVKGGIVRSDTDHMTTDSGRFGEL